MNTFLLLKPDDFQDLVSMDEAIDAVEQGYIDGMNFPVINAPRRRVHSPSGVRISNFPGGSHTMGVIGAASRADHVIQEEGGANQHYAYREHPVHVLNNSETGELLAIVIGEPVERTLGYTSLVALRTAATSGVGFRYLTRENSTQVGLFGSGGQAANQLLALKCARPGIQRVRVYSRDPENRRAFAEKYGPKFNLQITPVSSGEEAIRGADVVLCATSTNVELFDGNLLEPGQHVTGIIGGNVQLVEGGFLKKARREIDNRTVERADIVVTNLKESVISEKQGDLYEPLELGIISEDDILELGPLAAGQVDGRSSDDQITYHKNNNGTAASEIAIAMLVYNKAKESGRGTEIDLIAAADLPHAL
ncbi:MAG: ornithine cyclodeaminase family protein [Rhodospirillaceae bacterium]|jgi:alanine dehydrogenase